MARKLTQNEIETAARHTSQTYYSEGSYAAEKEARELKSQMILKGNTDRESIATFNRYASNSWDWL